MAFNTREKICFSMIRTWTLARREIKRYTAVILQTLFSPTLSATLYFVVFGKAIGRYIDFDKGPYIRFIIPGLIMMNLMNGAFMNTASSILQSKLQGNIKDLLVSPVRHYEIVVGYVLGAVSRGLLTGGCIYGVSIAFYPFLPAHPAVVVAIGVVGAIVFALIGLIAGFLARTWGDAMAFSTFVIMPFSYLGGVFFSVDMLGPRLQLIARFNPLLYLIDTMRYGFLGVSDMNPLTSLFYSATFVVVLFGIALAVVNRCENIQL